jgi:hypothetical protein
VNRQEHDLMLSLFGVQLQVSVMILEVLQSRQIADTGDVGPFVALALAKMNENIPVFAKTYASVARQVGVQLPEGFAPNA